MNDREQGSNSSLNIKRDDETCYRHGLILFYLSTQILNRSLSEVLRDHISKDKRRKICELFNQQLARLLDCGWIEEDCGRIEPLLTFVRRGESTEASRGKVTELILPELETMLEDGADHGSIFAFFDGETDILSDQDFRWGIAGDVQPESSTGTPHQPEP